MGRRQGKRRMPWPGGTLRAVAASAAWLAVLAFLLAPPADADGLGSPTPAASGGAGGLGIGGQFGISPAPDSQGRAPSYFQLSLAPGQSVTAEAEVTNLSDGAQTLDVGRAIGVTAANGGSAYQPEPARCSGADCWVNGLPRQVTLPGRTRELLAFKVTVPAGTAHGQYLTGISAKSAGRPRTVKVGTNGNAGARAAIVQDVTVGVAVTVGDLSTLTTRLRIPGVTGADEGPTARLNIQLANTGQTFARGTGTASCTADRTARPYHYHVLANTVLPQDHAVITVNAPGLPEGTTVPCTIKIHYGMHQTVVWTGMVNIPGAPSGRIEHTGPGAYSQIQPGGLPGWVIALIVVSALLLATVIVLLLRLRRSRLPGRDRRVAVLRAVAVLVALAAQQHRPQAEQDQAADDHQGNRPAGRTTAGARRGAAADGPPGRGRPGGWHGDGPRPGGAAARVLHARRAPPGARAQAGRVDREA